MIRMKPWIYSTLSSRVQFLMRQKVETCVSK